MVKVKFIRLLTLVLFERVPLAEFKCKIWSVYLLFKKPTYGQGLSFLDM